jgi:hypothetical protein
MSPRSTFHELSAEASIDMSTRQIAEQLGTGFMHDSEARRIKLDGFSDPSRDSSALRELAETPYSAATAFGE